MAVLIKTRLYRDESPAGNPATVFHSDHSQLMRSQHRKPSSCSALLETKKARQLQASCNSIERRNPSLCMCLTFFPLPTCLMNENTLQRLANAWKTFTSFMFFQNRLGNSLCLLGSCCVPFVALLGNPLPHALNAPSTSAGRKRLFCKWPSQPGCHLSKNISSEINPVG